MFTPMIKTDLSALPQLVESNLDELDPIIAEAIGKVRGLVVTDTEGMRHAEEQAAWFNKRAAEVNAFRKTVLEKWNKPMADLDGRAMTYVKRLKDTARELLDKVNVIKDEARAKKREDITSWVTRKVAEAFPEDIDTQKSLHWGGFIEEGCNAKKGSWLNAGTSNKTVAEQVTAEIKRVAESLAAVDATYSTMGAEAQVKAKMELRYRRFNLAEVAAEMLRWQNERKVLEQVKSEQEKVAPPPPVQPQPQKVETPKPQPVQGKTMTYALRFTGGTPEDMGALLAMFAEQAQVVECEVKSNAPRSFFVNLKAFAAERCIAVAKVQQ